jgi:hypothetical protein
MVKLYFSLYDNIYLEDKDPYIESDKYNEIQEYIINNQLWIDEIYIKYSFFQEYEKGSNERIYKYYSDLHRLIYNSGDDRFFIDSYKGISFYNLKEYLKNNKKIQLNELCQEAFKPSRINYILSLNSNYEF